MTVNSENNPAQVINQDKIENKLPENQQINPQTPEVKKEEVHEDPNWRAFREARKQDRQQREAAERKAAEKEAEAAALKAALEAAFNRQPIQNNLINEQEEETEDQRIEKKVQAALAQREIQAEKLRLEREQQEYPERLRKSFPDFNNMISQENLDYLDYHYPEVSRPLQRLNDGFDKWSDIYHAIKKFVPNSISSKKENLKADINLNKPKSMSNTGMTQTGDGQINSRLTEEKKAANWERMQKLLKGVS